MSEASPPHQFADSILPSFPVSVVSSRMQRAASRFFGMLGYSEYLGEMCKGAKTEGMAGLNMSSRSVEMKRSSWRQRAHGGIGGRSLRQAILGRAQVDSM